jgi:nucleoside recognition membrane protein YjiH
LLVGVAYLFEFGPAALYQPDMLPFLFEKLVLSLTVIVPLGAIALVFLIGFGLLELVGVLMQPVMHPLWRTPGKSAIDAIASFAGSYSVGLLITDRMYREGQYSLRDAAIIATGFSTVSVPFLVVVARTLDLMEHWNLYFWSTLLITFLVTSVTARIYPLASLPAERLPEPELEHGVSRFASAWQAGVARAACAPSLPVSLWGTFVDGLRMTAYILPSILAVGLLGLLAAKYTPLFDAIGLLLYPLTWLFGLEQPMQVASALASGLAEMFLPVILLKDADQLVRFVTAIVSVSSVLFFSASIPCMLATRIPLRLRDLLLVWLQRCLLSLLFSLPLGHLALYLGWL